MKKFTTLVAFSLLSAPLAQAVTPSEPNLGATVYLDVQTLPATTELSWWGKAGCHYVVETTLEMGTPWIVLNGFNPSGNTAPLAVGAWFSGTDKVFFRILEINPADLSALRTPIPTVFPIPGKSATSATSTPTPPVTTTLIVSTISPNA